MLQADPVPFVVLLFFGAFGVGLLAIAVREGYRSLRLRREAAPFRVEDDTGSVLVDPAGADLRLAEESVEAPVSDPAERPDVFGDLLEPWTQRRAREYFEARLDEGETVTVRGRVDEGEGPDVDARQVGVRIAGGGTLVFDALPGDAAGRAFRTALLAGAGGAFALGILALITGAVAL